MTAERYTAVFTWLFDLKKHGEYPYLCMGEEPLVSGGSYALHRGRPPCKRMGCEIFFGDLSEDYRRLVLDVYRNLWGLQEDAEGAA